MEGDTELGLLVKNTIDAIELPVFHLERFKPGQVLERLKAKFRAPLRRQSSCHASRQTPTAAGVLLFGVLQCSAAHQPGCFATTGAARRKCPVSPVWGDVPYLLKIAQSGRPIRRWTVARWCVSKAVCPGTASRRTATTSWASTA